MKSTIKMMGDIEKRRLVLLLMMEEKNCREVERNIEIKAYEFFRADNIRSRALVKEYVVQS